MKLINKNRRIEYLGFDDKWFIVIGVISLSFVADYLFSNSFGRNLPWHAALISWSISLFFSILNWFTIREILIQLRRRFPSSKHNLKRIIIFFFAIVFTVVLIDFLGSAFLSKVIGINFNDIERSKLLSIVLLGMMTMSIYEAVYYYTRLQKSIREEEQGKRAIVQAQLDALRNQAQPHFLFNTLNTLRDIIDQNTKEEAKEFVDKISDVYRFILESGNSNLIQLRNEIKFSKAYVHIQSERFGGNLNVNWNITDEALDLMIVPMSLQLLLENAIKHNVISKARALNIVVTAIDDKITVKNIIQAKSSQLPSTKLGLRNIQKRYSLISSRSIDINNNGNVFSVMLPLLLSTDQNQIHASIDH